jgi:hypothetical protein
MSTRELLHAPTAAALHGVDWTTVDVDAWKVGRDEPHPDIRIYTSWLPVPQKFETLVAGDYAVPIFRGALALLGRDAWSYATRSAAQQGHADVVRAVRQYLETQETR